MRKMVEVTHDDPIVRGFMLFMQVAQAAQKYSDRRLYFESRSSTPVFNALQGLVNSKGVMNHTQLAEWTNTAKHNISALVDRMKGDGLVTTEYSHEDRRVSYIKITQKGREVFNQATPVHRKIVRGAMRDIGKREAAELESILKVMKRNIERAS